MLPLPPAAVGMLKLPINGIDYFTVGQPAAAGLQAETVGKEFAEAANTGLEGLEDQVQTFYDIYNQAEATRQSVEKFILGSSCKTACMDPTMALCFANRKNIFDFI